MYQNALIFILIEVDFTAWPRDGAIGFYKVAFEVVQGVGVEHKAAAHSRAMPQLTSKNSLEDNICLLAIDTRDFAVISLSTDNKVSSQLV